MVGLSSGVVNGIPSRDRCGGVAFRRVGRNESFSSSFLPSSSGSGFRLPILDKLLDPLLSPSLVKAPLFSRNSDRALIPSLVPRNLVQKGP